MSALEVLQAAAAAGRSKSPGGLPPRIVRFELEYRKAPDLAKDRRRLQKVLGADGFKLEPLDKSLPTFAVLQFPDVPRTISTPTLYAMAAELVRSLNLVSCTPDIGTSFVVDPDPNDPITESVFGDAILNLTCWVRDDDSLPLEWAVRSIRADQAWNSTKGAGIVVAQPDSGIAKHDELDDTAFDLTKARNILDNTNDPTDPLSAKARNPGHGTATSSVVISRKAGILIGSAPEATLVPIRCLDSVVFGVDGTPIARAVLHAVKIKADVITMSLGGPFFSPSLSAAMEKAVDAGIIVVAAAGNCVQRIVVYPAADPNVIAVAGINRDDRPWKGTSRGPKVDIAAPAENVFVARRKPDDGGIGKVSPGQGTSYATALTAGVAALWLAHFGRKAVRDEAKKRGISVHHLFRSALRATARGPASGTWDKTRFGAGIVDAAALLKLPLAQIPKPTPVPEAVPSDDPDDAVNAVIVEAVGRRKGTFDWRRHGAEAVYLATDAWRRSSPERSMLVESARKPEASPELAATAPAFLRKAIAQADDAPAMRPPVVNEPDRRQVIRHLGSRGTGAGGAESSEKISIEAAVKNLRNGGMDELEKRTAEIFAKLDGEASSVEGAAMRRTVLESVKPVVRRVIDEQEVALSVQDRVTLEALVKLTGRPALRVVDGTVDVNDPMFGEWGGTLIALGELPTTTGAVGRIDGDGDHIGTGFVVGPGIIMTNRHVLEAIAEEVQGANGSAKWVFSVDKPTIDFSSNADGSARFRIRSIIAAGKDPIDRTVFFPHLDMALLEVETANSSGAKLPKALHLIDDAPELQQKGDLYVVGYPARPGTSAMVDPKTNEFSMEVAKRLAQIYNVKYGRKYLSPGAVEKPGGLANDPHKWVFSHDATTLGGNSGSLVVRFLDQIGVSGLHFGGATLTANYAHKLAAVKASGILPELTAGGISWI